MSGQWFFRACFCVWMLFGLGAVAIKPVGLGAVMLRKKS